MTDRIVALLLWLLPINVWTYATVSFVLGISLCVWVVKTSKLRGSRTKAILCAAVFLFLIAGGFARFAGKETQSSARATITAPNNNGIITQGQSGGTNTIINAGTPDRRLAPEQQAMLTEAAKPSCPVLKHVTVTAANSDHEAQVYALDFVSALRTAPGCAADLALPIPGLRPDIAGIQIAVRNAVTNESQVPEAAKRLAAILDAAHVSYGWSKMEDNFFPDEQFILVIGSR